MKYVYELIDHEGNPFYIGRTKNIKQRMYEHWRDATKRDKQTHVYHKIRKLIREDNYCILKWNILFETEIFEESTAMEIKLIKEYRDKGIQLTNLTDGGEGLEGVKRTFTEEWKQKLRDAKKKQYAEGYVQDTKGKTFDEIYGETKAKELKEKTGKKISEGIKNGTINHNKGKTLEELVGHERALELKKMTSERAKTTFTGTKQSQEHKQKRLQKQRETKANWSDEKRKEMSEKNRQNALKGIEKRRAAKLATQ